MAGRLVNSPCLINFASWNILLSLYISLSTSVLSWSADCYFCFLEQYDDSTRFREVLGDLFFYSLPDCWLTLVWKRKFLRLIISTQMLSDVYCHQRSAEMIANCQMCTVIREVLRWLPIVRCVLSSEKCWDDCQLSDVYCHQRSAEMIANCQMCTVIREVLRWLPIPKSLLTL